MPERSPQLIFDICFKIIKIILQYLQEMRIEAICKQSFGQLSQIKFQQAASRIHVNISQNGIRLQTT